MNKIYLNFLDVKCEKQLAVIFDLRLSFIDNFNLLNEINSYKIDTRNIGIYDEQKNIWLKTDIPIKSFNLQSQSHFLIF